MRKALGGLAHKWLVDKRTSIFWSRASWLPSLSWEGLKGRIRYTISREATGTLFSFWCIPWEQGHRSVGESRVLARLLEWQSSSPCMFYSFYSQLISVCQFYLPPKKNSLSSWLMIQLFAKPCYPIWPRGIAIFTAALILFSASIVMNCSVGVRKLSWRYRFVAIKFTRNDHFLVSMPSQYEFHEFILARATLSSTSIAPSEFALEFVVKFTTATIITAGWRFQDYWSQRYGCHYFLRWHELNAYSICFDACWEVVLLALCLHYDH